MTCPNAPLAKCQAPRCDCHARSVQDFTTPQGRADRDAETARRVARIDRMTWRVAKICLAVLAVIYGLILIAHAAPIAAHHIAFPATIQH